MPFVYGKATKRAPLLEISHSSSLATHPWKCGCMASLTTRQSSNLGCVIGVKISASHSHCRMRPRLFLSPLGTVWRFPQPSLRTAKSPKTQPDASLTALSITPSISRIDEQAWLNLSASLAASPASPTSQQKWPSGSLVSPKPLGQPGKKSERLPTQLS